MIDREYAYQSLSHDNVYALLYPTNDCVGEGHIVALLLVGRNRNISTGIGQSVRRCISGVIEYALELILDFVCMVIFVDVLVY